MKVKNAKYDLQNRHISKDNCEETLYHGYKYHSKNRLTNAQQKRLPTINLKKGSKED